MLLVENRRYLVWSGLYFLVAVLLVYAVGFFGFPVSLDVAADSPVFRAFLYPACLLVIATTFSALGHALENRDYRWLVAILLFTFPGAYFYGFRIAARSGGSKRLPFQ